MLRNNPISRPNRRTWISVAGHRRTRNTDGSVSLWETPLSCEERPIEEGRLELQQLKQYHGVRSRYRETDVEEEEGR